MCEGHCIRSRRLAAIGQWLVLELVIESTADLTNSRYGSFSGSGPHGWGNRESYAAMKAADWDDAVLAEHRGHLLVPDAQAAFDELADSAAALPAYDCSPGWHGAIRDFRYVDRAGGECPFAFIVNRSDLLFYVRKPGLGRVPG